MPLLYVPNRRRRRRPRDPAAGAHDDSCPEKADSGDDLRRQPARIAGGSGKAEGQQRKDCRAETDQHQRAQAGGLLPLFALRADQHAAHHRGEDEADREAKMMKMNQ